MNRARSWIAGGAAAVLVATLAGGLTPTASAAPAALADCPEIAPQSSGDGQTGIGYTVVKGTTPQSFGVEFLGILTDALGPGRDLIMVKVYDLPGQHVIDQGGGIWEGMSGSPVYVGGKLIGAVSSGFSLAPSPIGGLTPAADMAADLGAGSGAQRTQRRTIPLSANARKDLAKRAGVAAPEGSLAPLKTPLAVSGLKSRRLARLQADLDGAKFPVTVHAASRASAPAAAAAPPSRPVAGGNFAGLVSYGDFTMGGVGTTTYVCHDQALAFGHPLFQAGASTFGANDADALTIIEDKTTGSFKLANIGASFGTLDQDRLVGVRTDLSATPPLTPIKVYVKNLDNQRRRTGTTQVTSQDFLAEASAYGSLANLDRVFDELGDGAGWTSWTIKGTRAGGKAFSVHRGNRWASQDDLTVDPAFDLALAVDSLYSNDFEPVTISSVDMDAHVATTFNQLHVTKIEVAVGSGSYQTPETLKVKAGSTLKVRVSTRPYRSTTTQTTVLSLKVPEDASGQTGTLSALGGLSANTDPGDESSDSSGCLVDGSGCGEDSEGSLDAVISSITSAPRNDDVVAQLAFDDDGSGNAPEAPVTATSLQKLTVIGSRSIAVEVR